MLLFHTTLETQEVEKQKGKRGRMKNKKVHSKWRVPYEGMLRGEGRCRCGFLAEKVLSNRRELHTTIPSYRYEKTTYTDGTRYGWRLMAVDCFAPISVSCLALCNKSQQDEIGSEYEGNLVRGEFGTQSIGIRN